LVFDAVFDEHRGVIIFTKLFDGTVKKQDKLNLFKTKQKLMFPKLDFFRRF
jgi:translation elongation factor EF-4